MLQLPGTFGHCISYSVSVDEVLNLPTFFCLGASADVRRPRAALLDSYFIYLFIYFATSNTSKVDHTIHSAEALAHPQAARDEHSWP